MEEYKKSGRDYVAQENYLRAKEEYEEALKLAKKLKKGKEKEEFASYQLLIDQILLGEEALKEEKYKEAWDLYQKALKLSRDTGNMGKDYLEEQLEKIRCYLDVLDLLDQGEKRLKNKDRAGAMESFQKAKDLANQIFYQEAKQEASEKLDKMEEQIAAEKEKKEKEEEKKKEAQEEKKKAKEEKKQKEEEEKKAEEERKQAEEEEAKKQKKEEEEKQRQLEEEREKEEEEKRKQKEEEEREEERKRAEERLNALEIEKKGNAAYEAGDYEDASMYFLTAQDLYRQLGLTKKTAELEKKLKLTEQKRKQKQKDITKADAYVSDGDNLAQKEQYEEAILIYLIAKDIYEASGDAKKADSVAAKITAAEKILENQKSLK